MHQLLGPYGPVFDYCIARVEMALGDRDERGEITEKTILVAAFALITLLIVGIVATKLKATATAVNTTPPAP